MLVLLICTTGKRSRRGKLIQNSGVIANPLLPRPKKHINADVNKTKIPWTTSRLRPLLILLSVAPYRIYDTNKMNKIIPGNAYVPGTTRKRKESYQLNNIRLYRTFVVPTTYHM